MTTKEELLGKLLRLKPTSAEESLAQSELLFLFCGLHPLTSAARRKDDDDDIEVGTSMLSLKDPVRSVHSLSEL